MIEAGTRETLTGGMKTGDRAAGQLLERNFDKGSFAALALSVAPARFVKTEVGRAAELRVIKEHVEAPTKPIQYFDPSSATEWKEAHRSDLRLGARLVLVDSGKQEESPQMVVLGKQSEILSKESL